jgi:REP element-mobilizing transposase RayT
MPQSYVSLHYRLIFSTRDREPWLSEGLRPRLFEYVGGILKGDGCRLLAAGGMPDHLHWLVGMHQSVSVAEVLRTIKSSSSKWIHQTFPDLEGFAWQAGYGAFAVSCSNLPQMESYILNQAEHHRRRSFQDEFLIFLKRHRIAFEDRYLWD